MNPYEQQAREEVAAEPKFPLLLSVEDARTFLDWGMSEEAVAGWMDWLDEDLRERLVAFIEAGQNGQAVVDSGA